jgi:hypothetical protein
MKSRLKLSNDRLLRAFVIHGFLMISLLLITGCSSPSNQEKKDKLTGRLLPKVLFITSGISDEEPKLASGIVVAIQSFNKRGVPVRLEARDILYDYDELSRYAIIILSTFPGYHDADRRYSLSYMSDEELGNLEKFVRNGGVIITGDNVGRNYSDGTDRTILFNELTEDNWALSKCYGTTLTERNVIGYGFSGHLPGTVRMDFSSGQTVIFPEDMWVLVPKNIQSKGADILVSMSRAGDTIPGILENKYGNGMAFFLTSSGFLHPINDGGYWSVDQIDTFYGYVLDAYNSDNGIKARLNPWPDGAAYAFCVSLNAQGDRDQYDRVFKKLKNEDIAPTIFVPGTLDQNTREHLLSYNYPLASSGFSFINFRELNYPVTVEEILRNASSWNNDFTGFRFPFTMPTFYGIITLQEHGYKFESSIAANNLDFIQGAVIPYNLVASRDGFYKRTDILEIAPTYHDDYYFLGSLDKTTGTDSNYLSKNVRVYSEYLKDFWQYAVKPYNGLMVFLGHPRYVGYNDATLSALSDLIDLVKKDKAWIASLDQVAKFRNGLGAMEFYSEPVTNGSEIRIAAPDGIRLQGVCLNVEGKVKSATAKQGKTKVMNSGSRSQIIFEAFDGQTVNVRME